MSTGKEIPWRGEFAEKVLYAPKTEPGFVAWAAAWEYGDGRVGVCFDEIQNVPDPAHVPPKLEYAEAAGVPVSYESVEAGSAALTRFRVYMASKDGRNFSETGRCRREEGSFCTIGFPDGRLVGYDVPRRDADGCAWSTFIAVRESLDGGATWVERGRLLEGCAPYLWRVRKLPSGKILLLASLYGTPWGPGRERPTRNTTLPEEDYVGKIQTFFMESRDGIAFSGPHYILPGLDAHEFDVAEYPDGRLLFLAGDVQGTKVGRQFVALQNGRWISGPVLPIHAGAPPSPGENPQGGFLPETFVYVQKSGALLGYRRNCGWSISSDDGANWTRVQPPNEERKLYQPMLLLLSDGTALLFGHAGGDQAFGEAKMCMYIERAVPESVSLLKKPARLSLRRCLSADGSQYENVFAARLTANGEPLAGRCVRFRFTTYWNEDGSVNQAPQQKAPLQVSAVTDADGCAKAAADAYDHRADIHLSYMADCVFAGDAETLPCESPKMTVLALTPKRRCPYPYEAYFAGGVLYLSPDFLQAFPYAVYVLKQHLGERRVPVENLGREAALRLCACGAAQEKEGSFFWISSVHAPSPLADVCAMAAGEWYV